MTFGNNLALPCLRQFIALILIAPIAGAVELAELAGTWSLNALETPARLRETFYKPALTDEYEVTTPESIRDGAHANETAGFNEHVVNVYFPDPFLVETSSFQIAIDGSLSGSETGNITQINGNRLTVEDDGETFTVYANAAGDILKQSSADANVQGLVILLKQPESLTTSELEGTWSIVSFAAPEDILVDIALAPIKVQDFYVDINRVVDTSFAGDFAIFDGTIEINSLGEMTGDVEGSATAFGPGTVSVDVGDLVLSFVINASKNTMIATLTQDDEVEYIMLVKKPSALTTNELAGSWRFTALEVATQYHETYIKEDPFQFRQVDISQSPLTDEQWVDISHTGSFQLNRLSLQVGESGAFSGFGGGSLTANDSQGVNLLIDGDTLPLHCNADKTLLTGVIDDGDAQTLVVGIRVSGEPPATFDKEVALDLAPAGVGEPFMISWNGASNLTLQTYNPEEGWVNVDLPDGTDSFSVDPAEFGSTALFRIADGLNEEE